MVGFFLLALKVRIKVCAAGVNFGDLLMIQGAYQEKPPLPFVAGTVIICYFWKPYKSLVHALLFRISQTLLLTENTTVLSPCMNFYHN